MKKKEESQGEAALEELIIELRSNLASKLEQDPSINNDWYLRRFLIARKYQIKEATDMLGEHLDFRVKNLKGILKMKFDQQLMDSYNDRGLMHTTKEGLPVLVERFGGTNY